jgi:hypothetical protein
MVLPNTRPTLYKCDGKPANSTKEDCITILRGKIANGVNATYLGKPLSSKGAVGIALGTIKRTTDEIDSKLKALSNNKSLIARLNAVPARSKHFYNLVKVVNDTKLATDDANKKYTDFLRVLDAANNTVPPIPVISSAAQAYTALSNLQGEIRRWPQIWGHFGYADGQVKKMVSDSLGNYTKMFKADDNTTNNGANAARAAVLAIRAELTPYKKESDKEEAAKEQAAAAAAAELERTPVEKDVPIIHHDPARPDVMEPTLIYAKPITAPRVIYN